MGCGPSLPFRENPFGGYEIKGFVNEQGQDCCAVAFSERRTLFFKESLFMGCVHYPDKGCGLHLNAVQYDPDNLDKCCFFQVGVAPSKQIKEYDKDPVPYLTPGVTCATWGLSSVRHPIGPKIGYTSFFMGVYGDLFKLEGVNEKSSLVVEALSHGALQFFVNGNKIPYGIEDISVKSKFCEDVNVYITGDAGCSFVLMESVTNPIWRSGGRIKFLPAKPKADRKDVVEVKERPSPEQLLELVK